MTFLRKALIVILCLLALVLILNYGLTYWVSKKLPTIINSEKDFPYNISYEELDIDILSGSFTVYNAAIAPKDSLASVSEEGIFGKIEQISVRHFSLWDLLRKDRINVKRIVIEQPEIVLHDRKKRYTVQEDLVKPFKNSITTEVIELKNGKFMMLDSLEKFKVKALNINLEFTNIKVDSTTLDANVPAKYSSYNLSCDSLFYQADSMYHLEAGSLTATDTSMRATNFKFMPEMSKPDFARTIPKEKDQYRISIKQIDIPKLDWGFFRDTFYVHIPGITLNSANAIIYRPKMPADDYTTKKLYSQMLREIKFDLKIDRLLLKDSFLEYQEQQEYSREAAKVSFSDFNAAITNLYSPVRKTKFPTTLLDVQCRFMKQASMNVQWTFNIPDESDSFTIKGHLKNIKSSNIDPVSKPLMNLTTSGDLNDVYFTFNGNRNTSHGDFAINYDHLKVELYKKDGKKKNELMTAVGNLLVKNDSKGNLKQAAVSVDRVKHKSVFNFLWRFLQEGLKKTLLPKFMSNKKEKDKK